MLSDFDGTAASVCEGMDTVLEAVTDADSLLLMGGDGPTKTALGRVGGTGLRSGCLIR